MAWSNLANRTDAVDTFAAADVNTLMENLRVVAGNGNNAPTDDSTSIDTRLSAVEALTTGTIVSKTTTYVILDNDGYGTILCDPRTGAFTITLPTASANTNRILRFVVSYAGGAVTIAGEGAETIEAGANSLASIVLQSKGDKLMIVCNGTSWYALDLCATISTGGINSSDWTNRHFGSSQCPYDGLSGTFTVGEVITEATSSNTGIIIADTGSLLTLKNVTGTGIWTNDRQITGGTSGATANVNVSTSTKNADTNITHNFGVSANYLTTELWIYAGTTWSDDASKRCGDQYSLSDGTTIGVHIWGVDTNSIKIQSGGGGVLWFNDDSTFLTIDSEDYSYKIITKWLI
jgi:hypothetical protein